MFDTVDSLHWFSSENQFIWVGNPMDFCYETKIFVGKGQSAVIFVGDKFSFPLNEGENLMCESNDAHVHEFFNEGATPDITARVLYAVNKGTFFYDKDNENQYGAYDVFDVRKLAMYLVEKNILEKEDIMSHMFEQTECLRAYMCDMEELKKRSHEFAELSGVILLPLSENPDAS